MASILETGSSLNASKPVMITNHPFYPIEVEIANLIANEMTMPVLLSIFAVLCAAILFVTKFVVERVHPNLPSTEKAAIWWFVICTYPRFLNNEHIPNEIPWRRAKQQEYLLIFHSWCYPSFLRRLLLSQPYSNGPSSGSLWPTLEGIRTLRLSLPHLGCLRFVHGDSDCSASPPIKYSQSSS